MQRTFDRIVLSVPSLAEAVEQYGKLFNVAPFLGDLENGVPAARWGLNNTVIELVQSATGKTCVQGIVISPPGAEPGECAVTNSMGLDVRAGDGKSTADFRADHPRAQCEELSVDHVVLRTDSAEACIELFRDQLGIRLALDKTVAEWGGRMLFFRAGKLTLEVIQSEIDETRGSFFWGLAYQCQDLEARVDELMKRGVEVSAAREGRKPGTLVATLKSHCLDIPTLLIQPAT